MSKALVLGAPGGPEALCWQEVADRPPAAGEAAGVVEGRATTGASVLIS